MVKDILLVMEKDKKIKKYLFYHIHIPAFY